VTAQLIWLLPAAAALLDWYAVAREDRRLERVAKPATLLALIVAAVVLGALDADGGTWLLMALVLGLVGDVFLLGKSDARFRAGLAAFLVGHLAYVASFADVGLPRPAWSWLGLLAVAGAFVVTRQVVPATFRHGGPGLAAPVALYTLVIAAMLITAWWTGLPLVAAGATVFVCSDSVLATHRFVRPLPRADLVVMITYHLGQALIVAGLLR
jgi:uncharacterized membrane protein YhhN